MHKLPGIFGRISTFCAAYRAVIFVNQCNMGRISVYFLLNLTTLKTFVLYILLAFLAVMPLAGQNDADKYSGAYDMFNSLPLKELSEKGDEYFKREVMDSALFCFSLVCKRYNQDMPPADKSVCAHAYLGSGNVHYTMYDYNQAQNMYFRALEIAQEVSDSTQLFRVYNNLGIVYAAFNDMNKAMDYYKKAYAGIEKSSDDELKYKVLNNLLGTYSDMKDSKNLRLCLEQIEKLNVDYPAKDVICMFARGWIEQIEHRPEMAIMYHKHALALSDSLNLPPRYVCSSLNFIAESFMDMERYDSAEVYLLRCADIAVQEGLLDTQVYAYRELANIYNKRHRVDLYSKYLLLYQQVSDSVENLNDYRSLRNMEFLYEMNRMNKYIEDMHTEQLLKEERLKSQQQKLNTVAVALAIAICLLVAVYIQKRQLQQSYREIFMRNKEIVESEEAAKRQYMAYQSELKKKDEEIEQLVKRIGELTAVPEPAEEPVQPAKDAQTKYQSSSLTSEQKEKLLQAINEVMDNTLEFCNVDFTLEKMAVLTGSKAKYVSQVINETYGKNFNRYVNEYRIKEARLRLMNTEEYGNYTVRAIAQSVGFKSNSNFNILFKELTGITPSIYQEMAKK